MPSDKCWICDSETSTADNFCRLCGAELTHPTPAEPNKQPADRHMVIGIFLMSFGGLTAAVSLFIGVVPTVALGLASLLVGMMTLYLPEPGARIVERLAIDSSVPALLNIENLLDDLALNEKGVYIPTVGLGVCPKVFVPLAQTPLTRRPPRELSDSRKIFITLNEKTREGGILLEAPGRNLLSELELSLKIDFAKVDLGSLVDRLGFGFKSLDISKAVDLDRQSDQTFTFQTELVAFGPLEVKLSRLTPRLFSQVGTPVPSAIAAAVTKSTGEYVTLKQVSINPTDKKITVTIELLR